VNTFLIISTIAMLYLITLFCDIFTNAVEHLGNYFNIQDGALGSIFAAVGTAFPETVLPLIAVFGAYISGSDINMGKEIGKGAVLGSPFMLSTVAFFLVALSVIILSAAKKRDTKINTDTKLFLRDLKFFTIAYSVGILTAFVHSAVLKNIVVVCLLSFYLVYAVRTLKLCHTDCDCENECDELIFSKVFKNADNIKVYLIFAQFLFAIGGLVLSSHYFVENIKEISVILSVPAMVLSLFLAPVATELPEIINGLVWSKKGKDTLAISNITGAMIFQACIPMSIGIFFTDWAFETKEIYNILAVYSSLLILICSTLNKNRTIDAKALVLCGIPYILYVFAIIILG